MPFYPKPLRWLAALLGLSLLVCWSAAARASGWVDGPLAMAVDAGGNVYVTGQSETNGGQEIATLKYDPDGRLLWVQREAFSTLIAEGTAIAVDAGGNVYVAGSTYVPGGYDYVTVKYNPNGARAWLKRYDGPAKGSDSAAAIALDSWGNVLVGGSSQGNGTGSDYAVIKYRGSDGQQLWEGRYNGPANGTDNPTALAVDSAGNVYVTGNSWGGEDYRHDYATVKFRGGDGTMLWVRRYEGKIPGVLKSDEYARAIAVNAQGNVFVTGYTTSYWVPDEGGDYVTIAYNTDGTELWRREYDGPGPGGDEANAVAVDGEGYVYVTGASYTGADSGNDFATIKYRALNGDPVWVKRYSGPGAYNDEARAVAVDLQGNVYVTGESWGGATYMDFATVKYDPDGAELWVKRFNGQGGGTDAAKAVGVDAAGNVYVTGTSDGVYTYIDYATVKYKDTGEELWVRRYTGVETQGDLAAALTVDSRGNVYVTGTSYRDATFQDYATVAYNPAGRLLWVRRYNGPENAPDEAAAIGVDGQGNLYVTGTGSYNHQYATIKYRAATGTRLWVQRYHRPDSMFQMANGLTVDSLGNVAVTGSCYFDFTARMDYTSVAYDPVGQQLWASSYNGPANRNDWAEGIARDTLGNVYVTGGSENSAPDSDYLTVKYDAAGQLIGENRYDGGNGWDHAYAVTTDDSGNLYVTGSSDGATNTADLVTIKYNSSGGQVWLNRYTVPEQSWYGRAIAVDAEGNVYVTGESYAAGAGYDYFTIKYNSAGKEQWVKRYNGPGNGDDKATALAVDGAGNVYVTGASPGVNSFADYATVKYNPDGGEVWVKRYNGPGNGHDNAVGLALDSGGNLYVTGTSYGGTETGDDYATIKYRASDGQQLWVQRLDRPQDQQSSGDLLAVYGLLLLD